MENCFTMPRREKCCTMFCILKTVIFAMIVVFMLFLPLGDPNVACKQMGPPQTTKQAMCYLCDGYFLVAKASEKMMRLLDYVSCIIMNLLYDAKLKLYALLEKMDKKDLCTSVCCVADEDEIMKNSDEPLVSQCPQCKCIRKKCGRKPKTQCGYYAQL